MKSFVYRILSIAACFVTALAFQGCVDNLEEAQRNLSASPSEFNNVSGTGETLTINVESNLYWNVSAQDADGNILCPATDADSVLGLSKVAKTGKYSDLTGAPGEIPFETGSFSMSPMPGTCYYQRVGNFCFLSCASTSFNGSGNGAGGGLPFRAVTAKLMLCPTSYSENFKGELKVSGSVLYYNTNGGDSFSGSFAGVYQIEQE